MPLFKPASDSLASLKGRVVVLTGGSTGIGAATVRALNHAGASVVFGDLNGATGKLLIEEIGSQEVHFVSMDATKYEDNLKLFRTALEMYGKVDHAMAIAGLPETSNWFDPRLTLESVQETPSSITLDVDLLAVLYFVRVASVYLRQNQKGDDDKSLLLLASIAGYKEMAGMPLYQAAKHGVIGVMRSVRSTFPKTLGIRVNTVCPSVTETPMTDGGLCQMWREANLPVNSAVDIARVILDVTGSEELNGKAFHVEGGRASEMEEIISRLEQQWVGEEANRHLEEGSLVMGRFFKKTLREQ